MRLRTDGDARPGEQERQAEAHDTATSPCAHASSIAQFECALVRWGESLGAVVRAMAGVARNATRRGISLRCPRPPVRPAP